MSDLPQDVINLVIAARDVAYTEAPSLEENHALDMALEAFAERVPWNDDQMMTDAEIDGLIAECGRPEDVFPYLVPPVDAVKEQMAEALQVACYYLERNPPFGLGVKRVIDEALAAYEAEKAGK